MPSSIPLGRLRSVAGRLARRLRGRQYALRGTASLVLQGLDMNVDDVDILCDRATAEGLGAKLSESPRFRSYFGQVEVGGVLVEIMGDWQIKDAKGGWSPPFTAAPGEVTQVAIDGVAVNVTTIATELKMFALMGRWSAYHKIERLAFSLRG